MFYLMDNIQNKFKKEITGEIFSVISLKITEFLTSFCPIRFFVTVFFFTAEEADLLILVQFVAGFLLTIATFQEK